MSHQFRSLRDNLLKFLSYTLDSFLLVENDSEKLENTIRLFIPPGEGSAIPDPFDGNEFLTITSIVNKNKTSVRKSLYESRSCLFVLIMDGGYRRPAYDRAASSCRPLFSLIVISR